MDFFIQLGFLGVAFIIQGTVSLKKFDTIPKYNNLKTLDTILYFIKSDVFANLNLKLGKLLLPISILGSVFYDSLGLFMVVAMVLTLSLYFINLLIGMYKFYTIHSK